MNTTTAVKPLWAEDAFLRGFWVATEETPEWIAGKVDALLTALGAILEVTAWATYKGDRWEGSLDDLADIVRRSLVRDRPTSAHPAGEAMPERGLFAGFFWKRARNLGECPCRSRFEGACRATTCAYVVYRAAGDSAAQHYQRNR